MIHKFFFNFALAFSLFFFIFPAHGETFVAHDDSFRLDDTAGWQETTPMTIDGVLALEKGKSRVDIRRTECTDEKCLEQLLNQDIAEIKSKNMTITPNAVTGQETNRLEFSTGEPFYYVHFAKGTSRFSAGYFLINARVYSVLAKNVVYEEIDPLFALISPLTPIPAPTDSETEENPSETQNSEERSYDTEMLPEVEADSAEEIISVMPAAEQPAVAQPEPSQAATLWAKVRNMTLPKAKYYALRAGRKFKTAYRQGQIRTLITPKMPVYLKSLGPIFDGMALFVCGFISLLVLTGLLRLIVPARKFKTEINPHAFYPIRLRRLYGTPSVIFRARDNQGNALLALSSRWDSLFTFTGLFAAMVSLLVLPAASLTEQLCLLPLPDYFYTAVYMWGALLLAAGLLILAGGCVWIQFSQREIIFFDRKGKKAAVILQQGLWHENYRIYFVRSKDTLTAKRIGSFFRRHYQLFNEAEVLLADVKERSIFRSLLRKITGHLWGFLRADYDITGSLESVGGLESTRSTAARYICNMDKPEAVNSRDLFALSLLIAIRDRDKWYPYLG